MATGLSNIGPHTLANPLDADLYNEELASLEKSREDAFTRSVSTSPSDYLNGVMGLTGICCGFAIDCASRVEKWMRSETRTPFTLPDSPTVRIQHLEKLLILAAFQSLRPGDDWREIRQSWDPALVQAVQKKYQEVLLDATGGAVKERFPAEGELPTGRMEEALSTLKNSGPKDHFLVVFTDPDETLYKWHVVYLHPETLTLADGADCHTWRGSNKAKHLFADIAVASIKSRHGHKPSFFLYRVQFETLPSNSLLYDRITSRAATLWHISRHSPSLGCRFAASYIPGLHFLSEVSESLEQEFYRKLNEQLEAKNFPLFLSLIDKQIPRIPICHLYCPANIKGDLRDYIPLLDALKAKGASYDIVTEWVLGGILTHLAQHVTSKEQYAQHRQVLRKLLEIQAALSKPYDLSEDFLGDYAIHQLSPSEGVSDDTTSANSYRLSLIYILCEFGVLADLKKAVSCGADSLATFYPADDRPIDIARQNGHTAVVDYLNSLACTGTGGSNDSLHGL